MNDADENSDSQETDEPSDAEAVDGSEVEPAAESRYVELPAGTELDSKEAELLTRQLPTKVIVLAGEVGSGKTTILGTTFDLLLRGPIGTFLFCGSASLVSLEDHCYLARVESGYHDPTVERTPMAAGARFLHLRTKEPRNYQPTNTLFCDMSGEYYRAARDSVEECRKLNILLRADHIAVLLDGEDLAVPKTRHRCLNNARQLLRRFFDETMLNTESRLEIVVTKVDLLRDAEDRENLDSVLADFHASMQRNYSKKVGSIEMFRIAACPKKYRGLGFGYGLQPLLERWFQITSRSSAERIDPSKAQEHAQREMDRFRSV